MGFGKIFRKIKQARQTYNVVGNINEYQLAIGETTFTGLEMLESQEGGSLIDYGSLIYITLQRAKTAREAIKVFMSLPPHMVITVLESLFQLQTPTKYGYSK